MAFFVGDPSAPTRFGTDVADTSDPTGLFLKIFGGEVFAAFTEQVVTMDKHFVREIASGKSAQFPKTWKVEAHYHSAGQEMLGQDTDETERLISIDGLLVSHIGLYDLDEAMSHFDVRSRYTAELGNALARVFDQNVFRTVALTARDSATLGGGSQTTSPFPAGKQVTAADIASASITATGGLAWWEVMRYVALKAGQNDIPRSDRIYMVVPEDTFDAMLFARTGTSGGEPFLFTNRDLTFSQEGAGMGAEMIALRNVVCMPSNLIPQSDESAAASVKAKYRGDYSTTGGLAWHRDAVGTTRLIGMGLEQARDTRRQEDFIVAKMAVGHGAVRNEGAFEIVLG